MAEKKWFALIAGEIQGPFNEAEIRQQLQGWSSPLLWGRGQIEWVTPEQWTNISLRPDELLEKDRNFAERIWKVRVGEQEPQSMSYDQMVRFLRARSEYPQIKLWTEGYSEWRDLFQIHKLMDEIGLSRRAHPRVPLLGEIELDGAAGKALGKLLSLSQGGLGLTSKTTFDLGDKFRAVLKSPNFHAPLHCSTEIVYIEPSGYIGMKFISLHSDSESIIMEYIQKFIGERP